ncbi:Histidine kinase [Azospirillaceae bacterium]
MFRNLRLIVRLIIGFGMMLAPTVVFGVLAVSGIERIADLTDEMYLYPLTVLDSLGEVKARLIAIHRDMKGIALSEASSDIDRLAASVAGNEAIALERLASVRERYQGPREDVAGARRLLAEWASYRDQTLTLFRAGRREEAVERVRGGGAEYARQAEELLSRISDVARWNAAQFRDESRQRQNYIVRRMWLMVAACGLLGLGVALLITMSITRPMIILRRAMIRLSEGRFDSDIPFVEEKSEIGDIARTVRVFQEAVRRLEQRRWIKSTVATLAMQMHRAETIHEFAEIVIEGVAERMEAGRGAFYVAERELYGLRLEGAYGFQSGSDSLRQRIALGEGVVGQCALSKSIITLSDLPGRYFMVTSGLGEATPATLIVAPVVGRNGVGGVIELGVFRPLSESQREALEEALPVIALNLEVLERNLETRSLLEETQRQAVALQASEEELRAQSEEIHAGNEILRRKNQQLQEQAEELRISEEELKIQSEALRAANAALTDKSKALEASQREAEQKAVALEQVNRYKSEFLANMSHELRTPLNSLLILARSLSENEERNLTGDQVESAQMIYESGGQLLRLINDILDLSKIEAGKMTVIQEIVELSCFGTTLERRFRRMAESKGLGWSVEVASDAPLLLTDYGKLEQILTNLIGNAIKFTDQGEVSIRIEPVALGGAMVEDDAPHGGEETSKGGGLLCMPNEAIRRVAATSGSLGVMAFRVADSGIGIPQDMINRIFLAFEQVDGGVSRRFGGTGLGLTIAWKLAEKLGGVLTVQSALGQGSVFELFMPILPTSDILTVSRRRVGRIGGDCAQEAVVSPFSAPSPSPVVPVFSSPLLSNVVSDSASALDDRDSLLGGGTAILIIEGDSEVAQAIAGVARKKGFMRLIASSGAEGLALAERYSPVGIVLDVALPDMDGWAAMARLKQNPKTRTRPAHVISATEGVTRGVEMGAVGGGLTKSLNVEDMEKLLRGLEGGAIRRVLVIDEDPESRRAIADLATVSQVSDVARAARIEIIAAADGKEAQARLDEDEPFDCMVLDLRWPSVGILKILERAAIDRGRSPLPVVIYSGTDLSEMDLARLREFVDGFAAKRTLSSERSSSDRLLDEVTLFLHTVQAQLGQPRIGLSGGSVGLLPSQARQPAFVGKTVLVVDDDMRNAFALSRALRSRGFNVRMAENGAKALAQLDENADINAVLMDIMMPGMNGYDAICAIRRQEAFRSLPILALTAKAMAGDREKCLEVGANDYLSKPVNLDQMFNLLGRLLFENQS